MAQVNIFSNKDSRLWLQNNGVGTAFNFFGCHALPDWARDFDETEYIKCKSSDEYGVDEVQETVLGSPLQPTFSVNAYTRQSADFLFGLRCPVDFQLHLGKCSSPSNPIGYIKIWHFYRGSKNNEGASNVDYLGEEAAAGIEMAYSMSSEEIIEIVQVALATASSGVTEVQAFNDIAFLDLDRCEGDCGVWINRGQWGVAVADATYASATANVWVTQDTAGSWAVTTTDPFSANDANISAVVILIGETAPRIIVFRGNVSGIYGARASITDDWGVTWSEVDMGGVTNGSNVNSAFAYSSGLIYAVGNNGYIWYSQDRGASWSEWTNTNTGVSVEMRDIHTVDANTIYAVGDDNTFIRSVNGGTAWSSIAGPADGTENILTCQSPSEYRVFVGGQIDASEECLWVSNDRGNTWDEVAFTGSTTAASYVQRLRITRDGPLAHMVMIHGTGTSDRCFRTLDGAGSFERMTLLANSGYNGLAVVDINTAYICGEPHGGVALIHTMAAA